ncbi:DMT family transporter [Pacificimonas sp. WHA3]|uniref:DMT family transporter n=1 Tax=Pacificimonas pallii TaxID=2827236 RepID=A0ABS6SCI6_9SPHN|nr:DMT family transporter [Pacificimonas pallii]MBV7255945.1 DMT family transporter [Pacificimonas pallii]
MTRPRAAPKARYTMRASPIFLAILGIAFLSAMDAAVKVLALQDTALTATWLRFAFGTIVTLPLLYFARHAMPDREAIRAHTLRGVMIAAMSICFFYAISILSLAETITLAFIAPLIVPPLAALFLKEKMRGNVLLAAIAGFAGVVVTVQGADDSASGGARNLAIAAVLASAVIYAVQTMILRSRAQRDNPLVIAVFGTVVPLLVLTPLALTLGPLPGQDALIPGLAAGLLGLGGILSLIYAYARAEAQVLIVFEYTGLLWATLLGWVMFQEEPRIEIYIGAAIIAGACLYIAWNERGPSKTRQKKSAF